MSALIDNIYFKSPVFVQNLLISVYGIKLYRERYNGNHDRYLEELLQAQWKSEKDIQQDINTNFLKLAQYAFSHVPFYKKLIEDGRINPAEIHSIDDIEKFPIITKEMLRQNPEQFISDEYQKNKLITLNTSGTTGKTLKIFVSADSRRKAYAFFSRFKQWAGIQPRKINVTFAGRTIIPPDNDKPPFWRKNFITHNYLFSSYHLTEKNMPHYINKLKTLKPHFIDSYPSAIYSLARYMKDHDINDIHPQAIITSSETLLDSQRQIIEEVFGCPVFDQYGSAEQVVFVSQCEKGSYHNHPEFGYIEYLNEDNTRAPAGQPARLICSGFTNYAMPLIRYDIGDTGIHSDKRCDCGRHFPVIEKIIGRTDDILIMEDGREIGRLDPVFKGLQTIKEAQIIQQDYSNITVKIVPDEKYQPEDGDTVKTELSKRIGSNINIDIRIVDSIPRTSSGKFRSVVSNINKSS